MLAFLILLISKASYSAYQYMKAFPADARVKNMKEQYADLIADLDKAIKNSTTINELNKALEQIAYPPETILVVVQRENATERDRNYARDSAIINRLNPQKKNGSNYSCTEILNGSGYGQNNDQHFYIWQHALNRFGYEYIEIRLERNQPTLAVAQ